MLRQSQICVFALVKPGVAELKSQWLLCCISLKCHSINCRKGCLFVVNKANILTFSTIATTVHLTSQLIGTAVVSRASRLLLPAGSLNKQCRFVAASGLLAQQPASAPSSYSSSSSHLLSSCTPQHTHTHTHTLG